MSDDTIHMARDAGLLPLLDEDCFQKLGTKNFGATKKVLDRFVALVRADERERIASEWDGRMYGDTEDIDIGAAIRSRKP
jgi:hypothetical protein